MKQLISFVLMFALLFVFMCDGANAVSLEYYGIEDVINSDLSVSNEIVLQFKEPIGHLDYQLGFIISNLSTKSNFPFADCSSEQTASGSLISCDFIGMTNEKNKLVLSFKTNDVIEMVDGMLKFNVNYGVSLPIERSFAVIQLPENSILSETVANQSFFPQDGKVITDGRHISVYWNKYNLTTGDDLRYAVLYTTPNIRDPFFNYTIILLTVIIIVVMIGIAVYMKRGSRAVSHKEVIESVLNRDEKTIINILNKNEGKSGQKMIVRESGFSKAKVSRLVNNLKERSLVEVEPISGRENRIILKTMKKDPEKSKETEKEEAKQ